ncbi:MAG: hypothetical protein ACRD3V_06435 [Vicinamibacteria bacterium]
MNATRRPLEDRLREFLLGTLSEGDRDELERQLLSDDEIFELLVATEEELVDECLRGGLDEQQTRSFLGYLDKLPGGRARVHFARDLRKLLSRLLDSSVAPRERTWRMTMADWLSPARMAWSATALLLAVALGFLLGALLSPYRGRVRELQAELDRPRAEVPPSPASAAPPSVVLTAGILRGRGTMPRVTLSSSEPLLELKLDVGSDDYDSYHAALHDADARELFAASRLTAEVSDEQILIVFRIPTDRLPTGDYSVSLSGVVGPRQREPIRRYDFRVLVP